MKNIITAIAIVLLLTTIVSAAKLDISPSEITTVAYPNSTISKILVVNTDGIYGVYFNYTIYGNETPDEVIVSIPSPIVVDGVQNVSLNISFSSEIAPKNIGISITGRTEISESVIAQIQEGGGGGYASPVLKKDQIIVNKTEYEGIKEEVVRLREATSPQGSGAGEPEKLSPKEEAKKPSIVASFFSSIGNFFRRIFSWFFG